MNYELVIRTLVQVCADAGKQLAQALAAAGNVQPLYLYYKRSTEKHNGILVLVPDSQPAPEGFELATGEGLRSDVAFERYYAWVQARSTRLPVLAWGAPNQ